MKEKRLIPGTELAFFDNIGESVPFRRYYQIRFNRLDRVDDLKRCEQLDWACLFVGLLRR